MSNKRYTDEFKIEAVKQVTERGMRSRMWQRDSTSVRIASISG